MKHILIIEDDRALSNGLALALQSEGVAPEQCFGILSARRKMEGQLFDLLLLDINLPDGNGLDFLREIKKSKDIPVILLTANDMEMDIVAGLEMGADDYITKPFSLAVLRARVKAQLRKHTVPGPNRYELPPFLFDFDKMEFFKSETPVELSKTEQKLLKLLIENKGLTLQRGDLIDRIWTNSGGYVDENALSVTVKRLRDKLETRPSAPEYIRTVYGLGYTWAVR